MAYLFVVVPIIFYYCLFLPVQAWLTKDAALYYLLARSLAHGAGYIDYCYAHPVAHTLYPPGYPFLLSLVMQVAGEQMVMLRLLNVALMGVSLVVLSKLLSCTLRYKKEVVVVILLFALNPLTLDAAGTIKSEAAYILFSWLTLYFFTRQQESLTTRNIVVVSLLAVMAFYMRMAGVVLCIAVLVYLALKKRFKHLWVSFGVMLVATLPWLLYSAAHSSRYARVIMRKDYYDISLGGAGIMDIPLRVLSNLQYYAGKIMSDLVFPPFFQNTTFGNAWFPLKIGLSILLCVLFLRGLLVYMKSGIRPVEVYVTLYAAILLLYTFRSERFLLPLYPFLLSYAMAAWKLPRFKFLKVPVLCLIVALTLAANGMMLKDAVARNPLPSKSVEDSLLWIRQHTPKDAVIMTYDPAGVYLYAQRHATDFALRAYDARASLDLLRAQKAGYLLFDSDAGLIRKGKKDAEFDKYIKPLLERYPGALKLVYTSATQPEVTLYEVNASPVF